MANILLTTRCNRSCPYCFAEREMATSPPSTTMSWENLIYVADFLQSSGQKAVSLLGGEPTIHPECVDFILYLLDRGFAVTVFTNGMLSDARLDEFRQHLTGISQQHLSFVCNLNNPEQTPASPQEAARVDRFLSLMGPWCSPGFNIYRLDFSLDFLFQAINRHGMKRHLRLGIAHPIPGAQNQFISPRDIRKVIERLYSFRDQFDTFRVSPGLDCGFPLCAIEDHELGWLTRFNVQSHFQCGAAVDIAPDLSVYHCFPLSNYQRKSLFEFDSLQQLDQHFAHLREQIKAEVAGIFPECDGCRYQDSSACGGGGLCQVVSRFIGEARIRIPEIEDALAKDRMS